MAVEKNVVMLNTNFLMGKIKRKQHKNSLVVKYFINVLYTYLGPRRRWEDNIKIKP
jgi:hypothetical protein